MWVLIFKPVVLDPNPWPKTILTKISPAAGVTLDHLGTHVRPGNPPWLPLCPSDHSFIMFLQPRTDCPTHQKFLRSQYFSDKGNLSLLLRLQTQNNVNHCEGIIIIKGPKSSVQQICSLVLKTTEIHVNLKRYISRGFLAHFFDTFDMKVS